MKILTQTITNYGTSPYIGKPLPNQQSEWLGIMMSSILIGEMRVMCYSAKLLKPWSLKVCRVHILPSETRVRTIEKT